MYLHRQRVARSYGETAKFYILFRDVDNAYHAARVAARYAAESIETCPTCDTDGSMIHDWCMECGAHR